MSAGDQENAHVAPSGTTSDTDRAVSGKSVRRRRTRRTRQTLSSRATTFLTEHAPLVLGVLIATTVGSAVLAIGAVHAITVLLVTPLAVTAGLFAVEREARTLRSVPVPVLVVAGLALYTALQAVPIPFRLLHALSPEAASSWTSSRLPMGERAPAFASISLDPGASCLEALKWYAYAGVFAAAFALARRVGGRIPLAIVFCIAVVVALITVVHGLLDAEKLYGLYEPEQARPPWALSPLLNANNLAGYLNLGAFCGLGLALAPRAIAPRWLLLLGATFAAAVGILEGSRGGLGALAIGLVLLSLGLWRLRRVAERLRAPRPPAWIPLLVVGGGASALVAAGGNQTIWDQLLDETTTKLAMAEWSRPMLARFPWFGIGRGAFETVFPAYRQMPGHLVFQHAENFVVQWAAEWGIPVALVAAAALFWTLRPKRLRADRDPLAMATLCGIGALLIQNLVDLGLEIASIALAFFTVLGALLGSALRACERESNGGAPSADDRRTTSPTKLRVPVAGASFALVSLVAAVAFGRHPALDDRHDIEAKLRAVRYDEAGSVRHFDEALARAIHRHPGDPYLHVAGALSAMHRGANPFIWLGEAVRRDPMSGRAHLLLAEALLRTERFEQGLLELRLAAQNDPGLAYPVASRVLAKTHDQEALLAVVPNNTNRVLLLVTLSELLDSSRDWTVKEALLDRAVASDPRSSMAHEARASELTDELERGPDVGRCTGDARKTCMAQLVREVGDLERISPGDLTAVQLRARLLAIQGRVQDAERLLASRCSAFGEALGCLQLRVALAWRTGDPSAVDRASNAYQAEACRTPAGCERGATWLGDLYASHGDWTGALPRYERAAREKQTGEAWLKASDAALRAGLSARASVALTNARRCGGVDPEEIDRRTRQTLGEMLHVDSPASPQ